MAKKNFYFYKVYKYKPWHDQKSIKQIIFPVHWDRSITDTIYFKNKVTLGYALNAVETFLSEKLTTKYINSYPKLAQYRIEIKPGDHKGNLLDGYVWLTGDIELKGNVVELDLSN